MNHSTAQPVRNSSAGQPQRAELDCLRSASSISYDEDRGGESAIRLASAFRSVPATTYQSGTSGTPRASPRLEVEHPPAGASLHDCPHRELVKRIADELAKVVAPP